MWANARGDIVHIKNALSGKSQELCSKQSTIL